MRTGVAIFITVFTLAACAQSKVLNNKTALSEIHLGYGMETVVEALGVPVFRHDISEQSFVAYYQTKAGESSDSPVTRAMCTPIGIENRKVVAIGDEMTEAWIQEIEERKRQAKLAEQEKLEQAKRQAKIDALEKEVKPIPAYRAALNLKLYRQLLDLDPDNTVYQLKVAVYEQRLTMQKKANRDRVDAKAKDKALQIWEETREERNKKLRVYTGNGIVNMAVEDMGKGSLYVWVKNVSQKFIIVHPDYFSLMEADNKKARCQISDSLNSILEPGSLSHGKISYSEEIIPKELILHILDSDQIKKSLR